MPAAHRVRESADPASPKSPLWVSEGPHALRADGEAFPLEATVSHAEANGQPLYTLILRDVQERHKAEAERQRLQKDLEETQAQLRKAQLLLEIDEGEKRRQVAEITETEYFIQLQQKIRKLKSEKAGIL